MSTGQTEGARYRGLRRYNIIAAVVHAVQAVLIVVLAADFTLPVTGTYMAGPPGTPPSDAVTLWDLPVPPAIEAFLALSALLRVIVASPPFLDRYLPGRALGHDHLQWV